MRRRWLALRSQWPIHRLAIGGSIGAAMLLLAVRLSVDVGRKPIFEDEALAGLVAAQPFLDMLRTVVVDRGGAPLHFALAHLALLIEPSPSALRWVSVVAALLVPLVCLDLGNRLYGRNAGAAAAALAASSQMLGIYGSFGRMYAVFALAAAVSIDLFVRATQLRTRRAALAAAAAGWVLLAAHPFGAALVAAEAVVAAFLWRGRGLRAAVPVALVALAMLPFAYADLRLADRFSASLSGQEGLVAPERASAVLVRALGGFAGGREPLFLLFAALAVLGAIAVFERDRAFLALTALGLLSLPALLVATRGSQDFSDHFASRQLIFVLPLWIGLVAVGFARSVRGLSPPLQGLGLIGLTIAALIAPQVVPDPRTALSGSRDALAGPTAWLLATTPPDAVIFPASPVFLAALPATRHASVLPREQPSLVQRAVERATLPTPAVIVAIPLENGRVDLDKLRASLGADSRVRAYRHWLLLKAPGPFSDPRSVLVVIARIVSASTDAITPQTVRLQGFLRQSRASVCGALRRLGGRCSDAPPLPASS